MELSRGAMALMRTSNPALNAKTFVDVRRDPTAPAMTVEGTVNRTAFLLLLVVVPAAWVWAQVRAALQPSVAGPWIMVGAIGGLVVALVTIFKKEWSPVTAPIYAALEGLALGGVSALLETKYPGIAMQSVGLTFATLAAMLLAYRSGLIKATEKFKLGVVAATGAIALYYLVGLGLSFFGIAMPFLPGNRLATQSCFTAAPSVPNFFATMPAFNVSAMLHTPTRAPFASSSSIPTPAIGKSPGCMFATGLRTAGAWVFGSVILNSSPNGYLAHIESFIANGMPEWRSTTTTLFSASVVP